jgi:hypothetical protein
MSEHAVARGAQDHRIVGVSISQDALKRLNTLAEQPVARIDCACGWSGAHMTMSQASAEHFGDDC